MEAMTTSDLGMPPVLDPDSLASHDMDRRGVLLAAPRGYCAGVDRAVITVEKALDLYGAPVYVRKQIVHNKHVVSNLESRGAVFVEGIEVRDPAKVSWLSQTTLSVDETMTIVEAIRQRFPMLLDPPSDDICYATQNRQMAVKEISRAADLVIVVGSGNSSNSVRLVEVALEAGGRPGAPAGRARGIDQGWRGGGPQG